MTGDNSDTARYQRGAQAYASQFQTRADPRDHLPSPRDAKPAEAEDEVLVRIRAGGRRL